ncbi:quinone oxidoreductase family protein [Variovorax sp. Root434]|uniref:quinone oxidoreductase family protein n=1 Tax=Variovorax sp. Root434 TaxID=1736536 RepID=UPI0006FD2218|nr:quinone oxidoreductase [Variovorax sp. Root434]KQX21333.1 hypothetical protein ASD05_17355 [Variovorax sp. Root434]
MKESYGRFVVRKPGAPEVLEWIQEPLREIAANEVRIQNEAVGVDFIDTMIRSGQVPATLPTGIGYAGVGIVKATGADASGFANGDRVAYMYFVPGSYAEQRYVPVDRVFKLPNQSMAPDVAAGALFRGLTAWYLATRLHQFKPGDTALVHAAAGGVGLLLVQWLLSLGVQVVGTVATPEKAEILRQYGCKHAVVLPSEDFVAKVKEVSGDAGAAVVYDSVGEATFAGSLDSARKFGLIVSFGWPSGDPDLSLMTLRAKGSLFITRPTVTHYTGDSADFLEGARALFDLVGKGTLRVRVDDAYPLAKAAQAHSDIAARKTTGSVVLVA